MEITGKMESLILKFMGSLARNGLASSCTIRDPDATKAAVGTRLTYSNDEFDHCYLHTLCSSVLGTRLLSGRRSDI